jgi:hypothetical protein
VVASHQVVTAAGPGQARQIAARLPRPAWQRYSAGQGRQGPPLVRLGLAGHRPGPATATC